jgi:hypothetical protein
MTTENPQEIRREAERIVVEDRVPTDALRQLICDYGDRPAPDGAGAPGVTAAGTPFSARSVAETIGFSLLRWTDLVDEDGQLTGTPKEVECFAQTLQDSSIPGVCERMACVSELVGRDTVDAARRVALSSTT